MADIEKAESAETAARHEPTGIARLLGEWPWPRWAELWRPELVSRLEAQLHVEEYREGNELVVRVEMPGLDPEKDVDIHVRDHRLHVRAERKQETKTEDKEGYRSEFHYGTFVRELSLPSGAGDQDVKATYKDGILEIRVPVDEAKAQATKVPVQRV